MTLVTFQDGRVVMRDGKVGTEQACCCGQCDCTNCDVSVIVEIESETIDVGIDNVWSAFVQLCFEAGNSRSTRAKAYCENGKVHASVEVGWVYPGYCARVVTYNYIFDNCGPDGCPTGEAVLASTSDTGEIDDFFGNCADQAVNRSCLVFTPPTSVTVNPLP